MAEYDISSLFSVKGMVFVITGGGSGLGEWMALALDKNGASKVFILGRRKDALEKSAAKAANSTLIPVQCDISSKDSLKAAAEAIGKQTPFVNVVIANGDILGPVTSFPPRAPTATLGDIQTELWNVDIASIQQMININLHGSYYTFVAFLHLLDAGNTHAQSRGKTELIQSQFITVASIAGLVRSENVSHYYQSIKAGLIHLTKVLATGFAKKGIRVNGIAPGLYITEMTKWAQSGADWTVPGSLPVKQHPLTRAGKAEDIAGVILFLASKAGAYINGNILLADGGQITSEPSVY